MTILGLCMKCSDAGVSIITLQMAPADFHDGRCVNMTLKARILVCKWHPRVSIMAVVYPGMLRSFGGVVWVSSVCSVWLGALNLFGI